MFRSFDADDDGYVTIEELERGTSALRSGGVWTVQDLRDIVDTVSACAACAPACGVWRVTAPSVRAPATRRLSLQFDVNHDKRLDMEEFIAMLRAAWT